MATIFTGLVRDRILSMVGEAKALAEAIEGDDGPGPPRAPDWFRISGAKAVICSWAVYDAEGRRVSGQRRKRFAAALERRGIGPPLLCVRERARLAEAMAGRCSIVLVPDRDRTYALHYRPTNDEGGPRRALQVAAEVGNSAFPTRPAAAGAQVVLRPFIASTDRPRLVRIEGEPRLIIHRPLMCGGRQLGTVVAAVPYGTEARHEQAAIFAILVVAIGALLMLALVSWMLAHVAMIPLDRVRQLVRGLQSGEEVERLLDIPKDEVGPLLEAYQGALAQSQDWADRLMESNRAIQELLCGAAEALVTAIEAKDGYTAGHSQRVAETACAVARELGWERAAVEDLRLGALLHDIGKVGINLTILNKTGSLSPEESDAVRQHPVVGARILSSIPGCDDIVRAILHHHERYDGRGYPTGIGGEEIPAAARIVAVADVYDALTSERSYRPAYGPEKAAAILEENKGTMFDPEILDVFLRVIRETRLPGRRADDSHGGRPGQPSTRAAQEQLAAIAEKIT